MAKRTCQRDNADEPQPPADTQYPMACHAEDAAGFIAPAHMTEDKAARHAPRPDRLTHHQETP